MTTTAVDERVARSVDKWIARGVDERLVWSGHPRPTSALPVVLVGLVVAAAGLVFVATAGQFEPVALVVVGVALAVFGYLRVVNTRFVVTDRALYRKTGILSRRVQRVALRRVQNSAFRQGLLGSLFEYGTIHVAAAGGGSIRFTDVDEPQSVRALVERATDTDEIPGTTAEWEAVLVEVRSLRRAFASAG